MKEKFAKLKTMPREKMIKIIVAVGIAAIIGILLSESFSGGTSAKAESKSSTSQTQSEYEKQLEKKLTSVLSQIDGIGSCKVMVTLDTSGESVYSADEDDSSSTDENSQSNEKSVHHVIVDNNGESPVLEKEIQPKVRGVIVVCGGADDVYVRQAVTDCLVAGLGVSSANISVVRGGNTNEQ